MADSSVYIDGVAEGAFTDALSGLPPWATENTAYKIQGILEKQLGVQNKMLAQLVKNANNNTNAPFNLNKVNDEFDHFLRNITEANKQNEKDRKNKKQKDDNDKRDLLSRNKLRTGGEKLSYVLTSLATIGGKVLAAESQYIKTYDALYKSGINLLNGNNTTIDGFQALNQMVNLTGMKLQSLQAAMIKYSSTLNAIGATKFTKALAQAIPGLNKIGFNSDEAADLLGSYIETQRSTTDVRIQTEKELIAGTIEFGRQLNKMSLATGKSRDQLLENMKASAKTSDYALIAAVDGAKAAENVVKFASQFDNSTRDMIMRFASSSTAELTEQFAALNAAGQGNLASKLKELIELSKKQDVTKQLEDLKPAIVDALKSGGLRELRDTKHAGAEEAITLLAGLQYDIRGLSNATEGQIKAATDTKAASSGLQTELQRTAAVVQAAFYPMVEQVNAAATSLKFLNDQLYRGINAFEGETRSWVGLGLMLVGLGASLSKIISGVGKFASLFGIGSSSAGAATIAGGSGASAVTGAASGASIAAASAGLIAMPLALGATGAYLQNEMNSPEGRKRRIEEQKKRLEEKKEILRSYKEQGATGKAVKKIEDEISAHEKLITDLSIDRAKVQTQLPKTKTPSGSTVTVPVVQSDKESEKKTLESPSAGTTSTSSSNKPVAPEKSDINSQIAYQISVLEQLLMSSQNLVSINKDILKYTRVQ